MVKVQYKNQDNERQTRQQEHKTKARVEIYKKRLAYKDFRGCLLKQSKESANLIYEGR